MRLISLAFFCLTLLASAPSATAQYKVVTGTVLLTELKQPDLKKIAQQLQQKWDTKADSLIIRENTATFTANDATVSIAFFDAPDRTEDLLAASGISWLWKRAEYEVSGHRSQLIISVFGDHRRSLELYMLFTRVAASALETTQSLGVFMNNQYLVLEKGFYLTAAEGLKARQSMPIYCWVYFGIMEEEGLSGGYTYGLSEFGSPELESRSQAATVADIHNLLYETALKSIETRTPWSGGDQFTTGSGDKLVLRASKGYYLKDSDVLHIDF